VLGDDHMLFLDALSAVLSEHGHVTAAVAGGSGEMVARVLREQPDACLIGRQAGIDDDGQVAHIIARLLAASPGTRVVVLSANLTPVAASQVVAAGASGYLHQSLGLSALMSAIGRVLGGEVVIAIPGSGPAQNSHEPDHALRLARQLTCRERECLLMLVDGLDTTAITRRLGVSRTTVRTHLQSVLTKLGVHSRLEAVSFAVRHRLPDLWPEASLADQHAATG
jgi:two-component system, NarL family, nitrate/nitrite response regulator NarL